MSILSSGDVPEAEKLLVNQDMRVNCLDEVCYFMCIYLSIYSFLLHSYTNYFPFLKTVDTLSAEGKQQEHDEKDFLC